MNNKLKFFNAFAFLFLLVGCSGKQQHVHSYVGEVAKEATCVEDGITVYRCECGSVYTEPISKLGHELEYHDRVEPTHEDSGSIEHYSCIRCNLCFSDSEGNNQIDDVIIPAIGHTFDQEIIGPKYLYKEATCTEPTYYYKSCTCGKAGNSYFAYGSALGHNYELSDDELNYICNRCHESMASGKGEYSVENRTKTYLFIGSSITNGYHGPSATIHSSMADFFKNDYLLASYSVYSNEILNREDVYLRKISDVENNTDGVGGTYSFDYDQLVLDGNGHGTIYGQSFDYTVDNGHISLVKPVGYLYDFSAIYNRGDTVFKYAGDGFTLSDYYPRYDGNGNQITWSNSYVGLMRNAINELKNTHIDRVVIQLSTNDIGQYIDAAHTTHLNFGEMSGADVFDSSQLDTKTSYGAMEWLFAKAREVWDADVSIFTCHMSTSEFATYKANNYDSSKVTTTYKEMYDATLQIVEKWKNNKVSLINLWNSKDVNVYLNSNTSRYYVDTLHLTETGYEAVLYQAFRSFYKKGTF